MIAFFKLIFSNSLFHVSDSERQSFINNHEPHRSLIFRNFESKEFSMKNEMYLIDQAVDVLIQSATHKKDYGRELETLDDVASVLNTLKCNIDRKSPITGNALKVAKYKLNKENLLKHHEPDWDELF